ncbi:hypothetical protein MKW98_006268 [Papaver atlanticum]|uniref:Uncharacterized protein n=1 Tax=Papaver atlanticum TaxID=357466 RepID=A0AAD4TGX4_9MAGN|nr:hypothetical protein MKW98_006268 [Papaver atlanticum]
MFTCRVLVVGAQRTGKTILLESLNGQVDEKAPVYTINFATNDNRNVRFICSESSNNNINTHKYDGFVVVFDLTNMQSYEYSKAICRDLTDDCPGKTVEGIAADRVFRVPLFYISAKLNIDVEKPFLTLAKLILK